MPNKKETISDAQNAIASELLSAIRSGALKKLSGVISSKGRVLASFQHADGRQIRRSASIENFSAENDRIVLTFEFDDADRDDHDHGFETLIRALDQAEKRPGYSFVALKWFRDNGLSGDEAARDELLREAIAKGIVLTGKVPNPKNPQFPVTSVRLNRTLPEVRDVLGSARRRFMPLPLRGEPLSQTVSQQRR